MKEFGYTNAMQVPRLDKIVINMGVGEAVQDTKKVDAAVKDLAAIAGQKPVVTKAKKSIATFKLRENMPIGCKVTLRQDRMYEFLDRLVNIALPRVRDFRGVSPKSFDGRGNYALGLKEQIVFPEINYDQVDAVRGMDIVIVHHRQDRRRSQGAARRLPTCRSSTERRERTEHMAKTSSVDKNASATQLVKRMRAKRARLKAIADDRDAAAGRALRRRASSWPRLPRNSSATRDPQPLRADRPAARLLSQIQAVAHRASRTRLGRARSPAWSSRAGKGDAACR